MPKPTTDLNLKTVLPADYFRRRDSYCTPTRSRVDALCCGKWDTPPENLGRPQEVSWSRRNYNVACTSGAIRGGYAKSISDHISLQCPQQA
jgi:hypothetical protein